MLLQLQKLGGSLRTLSQHEMNHIFHNARDVFVGTSSAVGLLVEPCAGVDTDLLPSKRPRGSR
jgi:hypothetical protein